MQIPDTLQPRRKRPIFLNEKREFVNDDDRVLFPERFQQYFPVTTDVPNRRKLFSRCIDELLELILRGRFYRLVINLLSNLARLRRWQITRC
ncbi:AAA+ superfamily ATPase (plasmid) [Natrarchaeobaculum sulfurireducens]|uniref:AAA+ superfamily ATPase n=1 Tax=Natrarchaeobaculum sulfurireducens TaxID=2044521 RepID=A0A346PJY6_9EURY|nr:AAA+ superfamily ATPase [Natrarchaeobaculum sulfurireducens]